MGDREGEVESEVEESGRKGQNKIGWEGKERVKDGGERKPWRLSGVGQMEGCKGAERGEGESKGQEELPVGG